MTAILEFTSGLLDGVALLALALVLGGLSCALAVVRVLHGYHPVLHEAVQQVLSLTLFSGVSLIGLRILQLVMKPMAFMDVTGSSAFSAFSETQVFQHEALSIVLTVGLVIAVMFVKQNVGSWIRWLLALSVAGAFIVNESWLSHAASRLEGGGSLMIVTMIHVLGATVWAGGIMHLLLLWRFLRKQDSTLWPELVSRFSPLGIISVSLIVIPGVYLTWQYVGGWGSLVGTGYGNMVVAKILLFSCALVLAALNFFTVHGWKRMQALTIMNKRVPAYIEAEIILAVGLLFTASSLTGFPPSVDVMEDAASPAEMWTMYNPKVPRLVGPELVIIEAPDLTNLRTGEIGYKQDVSWDRFNHNFSGVVVIVMGIMALFDRLGGYRWARYWPLTFIGFSVLIFVFANPDHWPLGSTRLIDSLQEIEVVQHWLAAVVVFGLGWFEWRTRDERVGQKQLQFMFPALCIVGGIILLTHSHSIAEFKEEFLIQSTHVAMGVLGILLGCGRWLEIRLPAPYDRMAGVMSISAMMLVGVILLFYIQPNPIKL
ncbi:MAG: CopD family protein [Nitrospirota bacterium]|nr:CopD family protein [Nitrospirota bacterium]